MHLLATPYAEHPPAASLEESAWYLACKSFFGQYVALGSPKIELMQAGVLIALFEHLQSIGDRALTTLGICTRLGYMLDLDELVAAQGDCEPGGMTEESEEAVLMYWGLSQLDKSVRSFIYCSLPQCKLLTFADTSTCLRLPSLNNQI
jgi:hypothetical protein